MTETLDFKIVFILLLSSNLSWILALSTDENHAKILKQIKNDCREIRDKSQYAALYVPPPNSKAGAICYVPRSPQISRDNVIYPEVDVKNKNHYPQNYACSTVDYNGTRYGNETMMNKTKTIHTEDLLLNLVIPGLFDWYKVKYNVKSVRAVYLYTYFLPCPDCFKIIRKFLNQSSSVRLYVGYTNLFGGQREGENMTKKIITQKRQNDIDTFLKGKNGTLIHVHDNLKVCDQPGIGIKIERDAFDTCKYYHEMLVIAMNFKDGKAQVWFSGFNPDKNGWVALLDQNNKRLAWKNTHGSTNGNYTFDAYIQYGAYVQYWSKSGKMIRYSNPWKDCGFGFIKLNKLAYTPKPKTFSQIKLTMKDGNIYVFIRHSSYYKPHASDFVMIQTIDQNDKDGFKYLQENSSFEQESNDMDRSYKFSYNKICANGFRAKYVYLYNNEYQYQGISDNASPIWVPGRCKGGD